MVPHRLVTGATDDAYRPDYVSTGTTAACVPVYYAAERCATTAGIWLLKRDTLGTRMLLDILKSAAGDREVGILGNIVSATEWIRRQPPELLVLGITATDQPWWPRIAADFRAYPACRTMVVTDQGRPYLWRRLLEKRGLSLVDLNTDSVSDLAAGFARFARGERYLTPGIVAAADRVRHPRLGAILSAAEQDVLCMVGLGMDTREIAAVQGVSMDAVRKRRSRVGQQLDVRGTSAIQALARDLGYATFTPEGRPLPGFAYLLDRRREITSEYIEGFEAQLRRFGVRKAEGGRRKAEGGRRKAEGGRRKAFERAGSSGSRMSSLHSSRSVTTGVLEGIRAIDKATGSLFDRHVFIPKSRLPRQFGRGARRFGPRSVRARPSCSRVGSRDAGLSRKAGRTGSGPHGGVGFRIAGACWRS